MMSVFSDAAPKAVKAEHAFRIFGILKLNHQFITFWQKKILLDFDGDDMLGVNDLKQVIERLIGEQNRLPESDIKHLIQVWSQWLTLFLCGIIYLFHFQNILVEADLDDDGSLSFPEFEHIIDKSSDFTK